MLGQAQDHSLSPVRGPAPPTQGADRTHCHRLSHRREEIPSWTSNFYTEVFLLWPPHTRPAAPEVEPPVRRRIDGRNSFTGEVSLPAQCSFPFCSLARGAGHDGYTAVKLSVESTSLLRCFSQTYDHATHRFFVTCTAPYYHVNDGTLCYIFALLDTKQEL